MVWCGVVSGVVSRRHPLHHHEFSHGNFLPYRPIPCFICLCIPLFSFLCSHEGGGAAGWRRRRREEGREGGREEGLLEVSEKILAAWRQDWKGHTHQDSFIRCFKTNTSSILVFTIRKYTIIFINWNGLSLPHFFLLHPPPPSPPGTQTKRWRGEET